MSWSLKTEWDVFREVVTQTLIPGLAASAIPGNLLKTQSQMPKPDARNRKLWSKA